MIQPALTIDGPASKDLDDALWAEPRTEGGTVLHVFVADPAAAVPIGSEADKRALELLETRYFASGNHPMLPRHISEDAASLRPHKERGALHVRLEFDGEGRRVGHLVQAGTRVRSAAQMHYGQVLQVLGQKEHPHHAVLRLLEELAQLLLARRRQEGALALYDLQTGLLTSEEGTLRWVEDDRSTLGQVIVQEAMIAANQALAETCLERGIGVLFRNHEAQAAAPGRRTLQQWLAEMIAAPRELAIQRARVLETVLERARYGTELRGHFGLAVGAYLHATSPIRRLADLLNHRQIGAHLRGEPAPYAREELDGLAERINQWRDSQREKKAERLKERADQLLLRRAAQGLEHLEPKAFSRVVKLAARAEDAPGEALCAEVIRRCRAGTLQAADAYFILWRQGQGWDLLRGEVARLIETQPPLGVSVAAISTTMGEEPAVLQPAFPGGAHSFEATARRSNITACGKGPSKKAAEHDAIISLFHAMAGTRRAQAAPPSAPEPTPAPRPKPPLPDPAAIDPISELQRYCQALPVEIPSYEFRGGSERGAPVFSCQVTVPDLYLLATSAFRPNKKDAKREAALCAIQILRAQPPSGQPGTPE